MSRHPVAHEESAPSAVRTRSGPIDRIRISAYTIPTDFPEADGTYQWTETTMVVVEAEGCGHTGTGYTYANAAAAMLAHSLARHVLGMDVFSPGAAWIAMRRAVRNDGRQGLASMAISAMDCALWDLKAHVLGISIGDLLGMVRNRIAVYGSGGFTSYSEAQLRRQLGGWVEQGIGAVKMKIGSVPEDDPKRVRAARKAIGDAQLFVDANGAYDRKQAIEKAGEFAESGVVWFEEPVSSDDLEGLRLVRDAAPVGMEIAAGEYGYELEYFRRMLEAGAVDVLQADATRCGGITGFLRTGALAEAFGIDLSAHTAPALHVHPCCAVPRLRNLEYFHDHARIEGMFFDGNPEPVGGVLRPDLSRPGNGLEAREEVMERYRVA